MADSADRLLLDVPCSGLGVLRRNPDTKWKLNQEFIESIKKTQQQILESYSSIIKKDGQLVYSTCSILPSENSAQVKQFLAAKPEEFVLQQEKKVFPSESGFDGFYIAKLKRIK